MQRPMSSKRFGAWGYNILDDADDDDDDGGDDDDDDAIRASATWASL